MALSPLVPADEPKSDSRARRAHCRLAARKNPFRCESVAATLAERTPIERHEIADARQRDIGGRVARQRFGIARVMALPHEYRGDARAPEALDRRKNAQLVVDQHIMPRRIKAL